MTSPTILVACIGNIFLGDDGFGVEVARQLINHPLPRQVLVKDFGIRGLDLAYALLDPWDLTILVDACQRGGEPGELYLIEPETSELDGSVAMDAHTMNPTAVLRMVKSLGGTPGRILIVGCEPAELGSDEEGQMGLSDAIQAAVPEAIRMIEDVIAITLLEKAPYASRAAI
jgi:hydrogenase maturation protease